MKNTPNDIEVLLHYYVSPVEHPRCTAPAVMATTSRYITDGILQHSEGSFVVTEKGAAWLKMILNVPYPTLAWIDDQGEIIK